MAQYAHNPSTSHISAIPCVHGPLWDVSTNEKRPGFPSQLFARGLIYLRGMSPMQLIKIITSPPNSSRGSPDTIPIITTTSPMMNRRPARGFISLAPAMPEGASIGRRSGAAPPPSASVQNVLYNSYQASSKIEQDARRRVLITPSTDRPTSRPVPPSAWH